MPEDWVTCTEFGGGTGAILNDMTRTQFLSAGKLEDIQIGPYSTGGDDVKTIYEEKQSIERLMIFYCVLIECESIW